MQVFAGTIRDGLSLIIALSCFLLSYVAYMSSASIYTIVIANGIIYILHHFYGARGTVAKLIYILNLIYPWLNPNTTYWSLFPAIIIGLYLIPKFRRLTIFRGLLKTTDDHIYEINGRLTHIEEQLKRMERMINQLQHIQQGAQD